MPRFGSADFVHDPSQVRALTVAHEPDLRPGLPSAVCGRMAPCGDEPLTVTRVDVLDAGNRSTLGPFADDVLSAAGPAGWSRRAREPCCMWNCRCRGGGQRKSLHRVKFRSGAALGFTGQSTGPHRYFHVTDGSTILAAEGLPFVIDAFTLLGGYPEFPDFGKAHWRPLGPGLVPDRSDEMPGPNRAVRFP